MKIKEIMIRDVISVKADDSAQTALVLLLKMQISGLPVIDAQGKLVGMFTEKDILEYTLPSYIRQVGKFVYEEDPKSTKKKITDLSNIKVHQLMRHDVLTVGENTTLCEVAKTMLTQKVRRLPVLDEKGKMVGIVSRGDVVKAFAKEAAMLSEKE